MKAESLAVAVVIKCHAVGLCRVPESWAGPLGAVDAARWTYLSRGPENIGVKACSCFYRLKIERQVLLFSHVGESGTFLN